MRSYTAGAFHASTSYSLSGHFAWSCDDRRVLIGSDATGLYNVYWLDVATGEQEALTSEARNNCLPVSAFPADDRVLFTADEGGNEINHLFVRELTGEIRDLTPGDSVRAMFGGWSADGERFYVASNAREPTAFDIHEFRTDTCEGELIFRNEGGFLPVAIGGHGSHALLKAHSSSDNDVYLFDPNANEAAPRLITEHAGNVEHAVLSFTRDGERLVLSSNEDGEFQQAWAYNLSTGARESVLQADWDVMFIGFSRSGRYRYAGINEDARTAVSITDVETGQDLALAGLPAGDRSSLCFSRDESRLALLISTDTSPADVYVVGVGDGGPGHRLTSALNEEIDEADLVVSEVVRYASFDGLLIPGVLYRPHTADAGSPCAALVRVHGGPGGQSRCGYDPVVQHLVNQGYAVFAANNRGSSGYGKTFFHLADRRHGDLDLDDIVYAGQWLAGQDWVDADRIGVMGGSYGGYMVGAALAFRPDAFNLGIDIFGVMNWVRTLESIPAWWGAQRDSLYDLMGDPAIEGERLRAISPLFHAAQIRAPMMVVQGANDARVLQVESDEIVEAVRTNGVPVEYVLFDDEGHGFTKRVNRVAASNAYADFLEAHL